MVLAQIIEGQREVLVQEIKTHLHTQWANN